MVSLVVCAFVVALTIGAFVTWVSRRASVPPRSSNGRSIVALVIATMVFGTSMTMLGDFLGASSPVFAGTITFVILGWTAFANDVVPMRLPVNLRPVRSWERRHFPYRTLGVAGFGKFLRNTPLRHLNPAVYLRIPGSSAEDVRHHLESAEIVHFWGTAFTLPYLVFCCVQGWWTAAGAIVAVHVPANLYPICHLRVARARLAGYLSKRK